MGLSKVKWKKSFLVTGGLFGFLNTMATTIYTFSPNFPDFIEPIVRDCSWYILLFIIIILLLVLFIISCFITTFKINNIKINISNTEVKISTGRLFRKNKCYYNDGINVISVSNIFIPTVRGENDPIVSTYQQFIREIVKANMSAFITELKKNLKNIEPIDPNARIKSYPLGATTSIVKFDDCQCIFLAIVKLTDPNASMIPNPAKEATSIKIFIEILTKLWNEIHSKVDYGIAVNMPLIGSGNSKVPMNNYQILQTILMTLYYETKINRKIVKELRIIIDKKDSKSIDLHSIKTFWDAAHLESRNDS